MNKYGIDVSEHNGDINWEKVKDQIHFAILRLGWIGNHNNHTLDKKFNRNYSECKRLGIPVGIYVYNYCSSEETVKSGANWTIENLKSLDIDLPIYFDIEDNSLTGLGKDNLTNLCIAFNTVIENAGFWAGVYANRNWFDNYLNKDEIKRRYTTWIATYTNAVDKYKGEYDMWQNSEKGRVSGIVGNVDTNFMYRDLLSEVKNVSHKTSQTTKSIVDLANEVIAGKYGDGEQREEALGSLYDEVQAKVNEILGANNKLSIDEIAKKVLAGEYGNGADRKARLEAEGYNYDEVQAKVNSLSKPNYATYTVKAGDTLSAIASKYNTTYTKIAQDNNISNPNKIYAGQVLKIYV